ncbi:DUF6221 family protein [Streptomyces rubiginosohelvolus]|uniref:DUF6221 family protein n=1 Tax=Streptomyces rubiginosohelvolus TaxID=67362 RepID=UPI0036DD2F8B
MTARGEDILAYLDRAISKTEKTARAAAEDTELGWTDGDELGDAVYGATYVGTIASDPYGFMSEGTRSHIALHDPESVLRRCAADRKLIAEHGPCSDQDLGCKGCGFNNQEESMVDHYEDCPVLLHLAEGYGWTEGE